MRAALVALLVAGCVNRPIWVATGVLVGGTIGLGYCWSECSGPWDTVSAVGVITIGALVVLTVVAAWGASWGR